MSSKKRRNHRHLDGSVQNRPRASPKDLSGSHLSRRKSQESSFIAAQVSSVTLCCPPNSSSAAPLITPAKNSQMGLLLPRISEQKTQFLMLNLAWSDVGSPAERVILPQPALTNKSASFSKKTACSVFDRSSVFTRLFPKVNPMRSKIVGPPLMYTA